MVDIKGLDKARVLKALYDHSHVQGLGFMHAAEEGAVTVESCAKLLEKYTQYDYLHGRVLKVDLSGDEFDERLYDRDCGEGAAQRAVDSVRAEQEGSGDAAKGADGEKKELSMEEKAELSRVTIIKILEILEELPPDVGATTCTILKTMLPGQSMGGLVGLMMGGPFAPPMGWPTGTGPRGRFG
ncbi:hypothetical protein D1641_12400 [Colidextribacter sp. OB.20]|uniref:hypothetical protein n=1 Tax=Colidextribacter sp. OB.20 TaxID=2304568 RepID=UPI0013688F8F|nr:hypothetical protein [Colidextribacter sp. OB.20]NBI10807.1 hypothetical protein [Colidextribacter sp. OB.20]